MTHHGEGVLCELVASSHASYLPPPRTDDDIPSQLYPNQRWKTIRSNRLLAYKEFRAFFNLFLTFLPLSEQSYPPIPSFRDISRFLANYTRRRRSCPYLVDRKEETVFLDSSSPSDRRDKGFDATTDATMASSPTLVVSRIRRDPWTKEQVEGGWSRDRGIISRRLRYRLKVEKNRKVRRSRRKFYCSVHRWTVCLSRRYYVRYTRRVVITLAPSFVSFFFFFFPERFLRTQVFTPPLLIQSYPFGNIQMGQVNERSLSTSRYHHWDPFIFFPCWTSLVVSREII